MSDMCRHVPGIVDLDLKVATLATPTSRPGQNPAGDDMCNHHVMISAFVPT